MMPERNAGHRVGYDRLDVLVALRAIVPMVGVLGDDRLNLFGDVFKGTRAFALTALQWPAATGAAFQAVLAAGMEYALLVSRRG